MPLTLLTLFHNQNTFYPPPQRVAELTLELDSANKKLDSLLQERSKPAPLPPTSTSSNPATPRNSTIEKDDSGGHGGKDFGAFVKLKKENNLLKMQISNLQQSLAMYRGKRGGGR